MITNAETLKAVTRLCVDNDKLRQEVALLREALRRYGDQSRMGTVEPMALQQAIDRALEGGG